MPAERDVIPILPYEDIRGAHDFLVGAFGFESGGIVESPDGEVVHGEVRLGDRRIWLHAATGGLTTPRSAGTRTAGLVVHVPRVDDHFLHAKAEGATITSEPQDQDYGQREYGAQDPEGHDWWFATPFAAPAL